MDGFLIIKWIWHPFSEPERRTMLPQTTPQSPSGYYRVMREPVAEPHPVTEVGRS